MLQRRGRVTAAEVADELEISERTARRDLDALGQAGVPVFSRQGRGGGWELLGGGRTDLSGLNSEEARALFTVAGPASGSTPEVRAALRKLVRALPEPLRASAEAASTSVVVDPTGWGESRDRSDPEHLAELQRLVVSREQAGLAYRARDGAETERTVHPLGIGRKGRVWYLLADTDAGRRTFRVDRVTAVRALDAPAERPDGFDLAAEFAAFVERLDEAATPLRCRLVVHPSVAPPLRWTLKSRVRMVEERQDGRLVVDVRGPNVDALAAQLAGMGPDLEVVDCPELRERLAEIGRGLVARHG